MAVTFRPGRRDDARFLATVMQLASRGHVTRGVWDLIIGGDDEYCLDYLTRLALIEPVSLCHYSSFMVAECDGVPAAALCGFDPNEGGWPVVIEHCNRVAAQLRWTSDDQRKSAERAAPVWPCIPNQAEGAWVVENVGTLPEFHRRGLVDLLMARVLEDGRRRGHRLSQITLFIDNFPAQHAYEKAGFSFCDERRSAEFAALVGCPGFRRMLRNF
jgi:ribosomal protein S18 acetylase RimI-like enzyme